MTDGPSTLLRVRDLAVHVGGATLVRDVSFDLAAGERVAVLGGSGAGKSLLVSALAGALPPGVAASGSAALDGRELLAPGRGSAGVALVAQDPLLALHPLVTVGRQLVRAARRDGPGARERVEGLLDRLGLADPPAVLRRLPGELSGGERQRVCTALALLCRPRLLVADEVTTALDVVTQARVLDTLDTLLATESAESAEAALLLVTHDLAVAARLCDRVLVVRAGEVTDDATVTDLLAGRCSPHAHALVRAA